MVEKVKDHINLNEIEQQARKIMIAGLKPELGDSDDDETFIDIPDVPLEIDDVPLEIADNHQM
jgi:hypothetical protein